MTASKREPSPPRAPTLIIEGAATARCTLVLAHGAGAPMDSPFLVDLSALLVQAGLRVARFEFRYMAARREGQRRPPDREPMLRATWHAVVHALIADPTNR